MVSDRRLYQRKGRASESCLVTLTSSTSGGNWRRALATASRTSLAAASRSRPKRKVMEIRDSPSSELERIVSMPSMPPKAPSMGWVTWFSITSALAPGKSALTETTGWSTSGNSRKGRSRIPRIPKTTIRALATKAITGRRTAISESVMAVRSQQRCQTKRLPLHCWQIAAPHHPHGGICGRHRGCDAPPGGR